MFLCNVQCNVHIILSVGYVISAEFHAIGQVSLFTP